ncbi:hypothetical protein MUG87_08925 [Ectobacillus sp. JY-23]|uniref:DUF7003 family protein n=1 Tax=Ectobacillus sp. JY-23 TaxID=2933872 RepID=UPI001FF4941F|nr:hypothetical protein [Ectobacillus sp. JY-23]UOY94198.1 hypothetical protein MUG87_08925 [Ectobacillus sp. JY-23]
MQNILKVLDAKQKSYEFPLIDNVNADISQVKLSVCLRNNSDWLIIFQFVEVGNFGIGNNIFMYGNTLKHNHCSILDDAIVQLSDGQYDLFDDNGEFIPSLYKDKIILNHKEYYYEFTPQDYANAGIEIKDSEAYPVYFMRMLAAKDDSRKLLWYDIPQLLQEIKDINDWKIWYETEEWQHVVDEKVSENVFFQTLAEAIEKNDINLIQNRTSNTHWKNWIELDFENQF